MKNIILLFVAFFITGSNAQVTTVPSPPQADGPVTLNFNKTGTGLASYNGLIYAHIGVTVDGIRWQYVIGDWGNNAVQPVLSGSGTNYTLTIAPDLYTYFGVPPTSTITELCIVFRSANGAQKTNPDIFIPVGNFHVAMTSPAANSVTLIGSGGNLNISASNLGGPADYNLLANGISVHTAVGTSTYNFTHSGITWNQNYILEVTQGTSVISQQFSVVVNPGTVSEAMPAGLEDGINYNPSDATRATLVLHAPGKDYVYVAGTFNFWVPGPNHAMRKDPSTGKFWLELTELTPGVDYTYQYWVVDITPFAQSPALVKTADPYSTLVLSPFDDPWISPETYPNLPSYPQGQEREVTVLKTGEAPYNWQVANFTKPKKEDLVVYEVLVRDFDADRNYQDLIDKIQYFKDLKINAIQLMPVMEFEGNESWGYNTSFHMANDKFYGHANKLRELVDLCHANGIAVILDVALNHAFGRNPMNRMWMKDPDGDGWGDPSAENPYFNQVATHSYSVGSDFNHSAGSPTRNYVKRVIKHWIEEFRIDGFRWDLTKGFTQNCTGSEACTNGYQQDRVDVLKEYADYSWNLDPTHYVIFEHLGADNEEQQWANYRIGETPSKGVMMWGEMYNDYSKLIEGSVAAPTANINRIGHQSHGFAAKRLIGYPESHDKERLMYNAMTFGDPAGTSPRNNLNNALERMSSVAATSILVPGPKMIWHFAELGNNMSIFTCSNGSVNTDYDAIPGDCKLDTKPQLQWSWPMVPERMQVLNDWSKMIDMKINEPVFEGNYAISPDGHHLKQRIYIFDDALPSTQLKNVVVLANFSVNDQGINPSFPYGGTWHNLMDDSNIDVVNTTAPIVIPAGQFRIYGNQPALLSNSEFETMENVTLYPNPTSEYFTINSATSKVDVYTLTGQLVQHFGENSENFRFDIAALADGLYLVKATGSNGGEKTMKLIKK